MPTVRDYTKDKTDIKRFLTDYYTDLPGDDGGGGKAFKYSKQLVNFYLYMNKRIL